TMRDGAMWFIKDPQNQNVHPIRDTPERPTFTHLYKFLQSAIIWKPREPLSTVPRDLVFMHLTLPYTIHYFRPRTAVRQIGTVLWRWLLRKPRASSYMFGEQHPDDVEMIHRLLVQERFQIGHLGTTERRKNAELNDTSVTLMKTTPPYVSPPYFKYRIVVFILAVWSVCCIPIATRLAGPVLLDLWFFLLFTARGIHGGYPFVVGFHLLWGCWVVTHAIDRFDRHRQWRENRSLAWWPLFFAKRSSLRLAQASCMAFFLVFVIPTLIALVMEMYVLLSIKLVYDPELVRMNEGPQRVESFRSHDSNEGDHRSGLQKAVSDGDLSGGDVVDAQTTHQLSHYRQGTLVFTSSQTVRNKEFLTEMRLKDLEPEEAEEKGGAEEDRGWGLRSSGVRSDGEPE
ncbi:hypothetical protein BDM02DRAFT_3132860, partial [Thelephora ganbajun]